MREYELVAKNCLINCLYDHNGLNLDFSKEQE